jgi:hypothetical protein
VDTTGQFLPGVPGYSVRDVSLVHEVQAIHLAFDDAVTPQSGTFTLTWGGLTSGPIPYAATASRMAFELQALTGSFLVGVSPVLVTRDAADNGCVGGTYPGAPGTFPPLSPGVLVLPQTDTLGTNPPTPVPQPLFVSLPTTIVSYVSLLPLIPPPPRPHPSLSPSQLPSSATCHSYH